MENPWEILKRGVNMFKAKKAVAAAATPIVPKAIVNKTPGGKMFGKRADDLKRALNDDFSQ